MRLILQLLVVSVVSLTGLGVSAQSDDSDTAEVLPEESEEEKSKLTDADRTALQDATTAVGQLIDAVEADSTSRKTVKSASNKLQALREKVKALQKKDKFAEGDAEKLLATIEGLKEKLAPINANLKAGETDTVEDDLPELRANMGVLRESIKGLK